MLNETIRRLVNGLDHVVNEHDVGYPHLQKGSYMVYPFAKENFHSIEKNQDKRRIAYVDGGNQELIGAPNFSVQLNRIYFSIFEGTKRIGQEDLPQTLEFLSVTHSCFKSDEIYFQTLLFPARDEWRCYLPSESHLSFRSTDRMVMHGFTIADVQTVASIARRFAEWRYSHFIVDKLLQKNDIFVSDGTLQTSFPNEKHYLKELHTRALNKGVILSGLAKTSSLFTTTGLSLFGTLSKLADDWEIKHSKWYYYPIAEGLTQDHSVTIFGAKLYEMSDHIFRYEISREQVKTMGERQLSEVLYCLAANSADITFPGYPYGLIDADDNARVKNSETEMYRVMILSELSNLGLWRKFMRHMRSSDSHDILNHLKGGLKHA